MAWILLATPAFGLAYALWHVPLLAVSLMLFVLGASAIHWLFVRRHLRRLAAHRTNEDIGAFAKQFDCRNVDTWVIRAVHEELQDYLQSEVRSFPLRASDRLQADLKIDQGDLEDVVVSRVAERTGRNLNAAASNPHHGKVDTVRDLVLFFNALPLVAEARSS